MFNIYIIVLCCVIAVLLLVAFSRVRTVKTKADFLVAGRSLPAYVLVFTLLSSWIGSGSLLGGAENAFKNGFAALWQPAGGWAGLLIIYFVAPRARKFAQFTIPDLLETRYNSAARVLGVIAILTAYTAITSYQLRGGGDILHLAFGIDQNTGMYVIGAFVIFFTAIAGMSSVAYLDLAIGLLATIMLLVAAPLMLQRAGGWSGLQQTLPADRFQVLGHLQPIQAAEFFLPVFLLMLGNQSMYQKFFSAKTEKDARNAVVGWVIGTIILETVIVALAVFGSAVFAHVKEVEDFPRETIPYIARFGLPKLIGALLLGAVFAKVISTANNYLFSPATNLVNDVYARYIHRDAGNKRILLVSRLAVVGLGAWAIVQAAQLTSVLAKVFYAYTIYSAGVTPVVMAAFFWKRATAAGAIVSTLLGTAVTVLWNWKGFMAWAVAHMALPAVWAQRDAIFPALIFSLVGLIAVSLLTPPPRAEQIAPFFGSDAE